MNFGTNAKEVVSNLGVLQPIQTSFGDVAPGTIAADDAISSLRGVRF